MARRPHPDQIDLLAWEPSEPVAAFPAEITRAATLPAAISKAVAAMLKASPLSRADIAKIMSEYLGEPISENMLSAYASEAREAHIISIPRFVALTHATSDRRGLQMIADLFGLVVIDRDYLDDIELAEVLEARDEFNRRADAIRRRKRKSRRGAGL